MHPVGIVVDRDDKVSGLECQVLATRYGFSEVVCVKALEAREIRIYSPQQEVAFAGHAVVGAAYFLSQELNTPISQASCAGRPVECWCDGEITWVRADLRMTPPWWHERLSSCEDLKNLKGRQSENQDHVQLWAWIDEAKGTVRARTFAPAWGIVEDEANGSGCMRLAATLGRTLTVHHGAGSVIHARILDAGHS